MIAPEGFSPYRAVNWATLRTASSLSLPVSSRILPRVASERNCGIGLAQIPIQGVASFLLNLARFWRSLVTVAPIQSWLFHLILSYYFLLGR